MMYFRIEKILIVLFSILMLLQCFSYPVIAGDTKYPMLQIPEIKEGIYAHLEKLTRSIGERSVYYPENILRAQHYIESIYHDVGLSVRSEPYPYGNGTVANVIAEISFGKTPGKRFLLGAHYDSVQGTVGADDNASAVAVQLETARQLSKLAQKEDLNLTVKFVSFALEEPPVYGTRYMGSRVYAKQAKKEKERLDGMICLEMVGFTCNTPGCQDYPFPLMYFGYPEKGNFIGVVGNIGSRAFTRSITTAFQKNTDLPVVKLIVPFNGWILPSVRLSDHASFWDQGYRAVMITDSAFFRNPHYHLSSDTMETLDLRFMAELVESLVIFFITQGSG